MTVIDRRYAVAEGQAIKTPCRAATTVAVTLVGEQTIDGIACVADDRVLVKNQADGSTNGIYAVSTGNWTRTRDFDGAYDVLQGTLVRVANGTVNKGYWEVSTANPIVIDTTNITFALTTGAITGVSDYSASLLTGTSAAAWLATLGLTGVILPYGGVSAPSGWLLCYGQAVSRTTYAALFAVLGTTYGAGDASTTFNVPDMRGRVPAGQDDMGGSSANRLTGLSGGVDGDVLGGTGGAESHTLTTAQLAVHTHTITDAGHTHAAGTGLLFRNTTSGGASEYQTTSGSNTISAQTNTASATTGISNNNAGSGSAHNNVQPTIIVNFIVKT